MVCKFWHWKRVIEGRKSLPIIIAFLLVPAIVAREQVRPSRPISFQDPSTVKIGSEQFDLAKDEDLIRFSRRAEELLLEYKIQHREIDKVWNEQLNQSRTDLPQAELSKIFEARTFAKKDMRGLTEIVRVVKLYSEEQSKSPRDEIRQQILEMSSAIANNHRSPTPAYIGPLDLPFRLLHALHHSIATGRTPASNLIPSETDLSRADPQGKSYWQKPPAI